MTTVSLRDRQAALARTAIFEALITQLEVGDADDVSMEELAREAGASRTWTALPGETVIVPPGAKHKFAGAGNGPSRLLAVGPLFERFGMQMRV